MLYIFDWDGTLCNSLDLITNSIQAACQQIGLPPLSDAKARSVIGLGLKEAMVALYPDIRDNDIDNLIEAYRSNYLASDQRQPSPLYPGVPELLEELISRGHTLAVATGKSRRGLDRGLTELKLHDYFPYSRCADECRSKPHPQMINEILSDSGYTQNQTYMIGDTDFDLLMGRAAGVKAVGVSYGAHPLERLRAAQPEQIIDNLSELLRVK